MLYFIARPARDGEDTLRLGLRDGDFVFLSATNRECADFEKCPAFLKYDVAERYRARLPWRLRERFAVISVGPYGD